MVECWFVFLDVSFDMLDFIFWAQKFIHDFGSDDDVTVAYEP
jgi:hypothetical protein